MSPLISNTYNLEPKPQTIVYVKQINKEKEGGDSPDSLLWQTAYNGSVFLSHVYIAYSNLPFYITGALAGSATKLLSHFTFSKVESDSETSWEKKSQAFGDASLLAKLFVVSNDVLCNEAAQNLHFTYNEAGDTFSVHKPFVAFTGYKMGSYLTERAIRIFV